MRSENYHITKYKKKTIAVIGGGCSSERDVSLRSANNVFKALSDLGLNVIQLDPADPSFFSTNFDIAFNCLHGKWGEDGILQGYCELKKIPYTGPRVLATSIGLYKPLFKQSIRKLEIITPNEVNPDEHNAPFVAKPVDEGSSIGVYIIKSKQEWISIKKNNPEVLTGKYFFEEYISGKEVASGVIEVDNKVIVLPILEIETSNEFYDFDGKYTPGKTKLIAPARIKDEEKSSIEKISKEIYTHFKCKGCIRIDIILSEGRPFVLEMNTSPGLTELSDIPAQASAMGISFQELVLMYLDSAKD